MKGFGAITSGARDADSVEEVAQDQWRTPSDLFQALHDRFFFQLDAAADEGEGGALCPYYLTRKEDALGPDKWPDLGAVFVNPPYSRIREFTARCKIEAEQRFDPVVALIPARTACKWWFDNVAGAAAEVYFLEGRLKYVPADPKQKSTGAPFASAVVVYRRGYSSPRFGSISRGGVIRS